MKNTRAYTKQEVIDMFIIQLEGIAKHWADNSRTTEGAVDGLVHSILATLDGCSCGMPAFKLIPNPHPDDKEYHISEGKNYYPTDVDIAGSLHKYWSKKD